MTTKPEAIAQIEAALLFIDLINSHEHVQVLLQIDAYSTFKKVTEPADMREVLAHIAAQDAEIARLREASGDPLQGAVDWLLEADRDFLCVATVQRTLRIGYNRAQRLCDKAKESAALKTKGTI